MSKVHSSYQKLCNFYFEKRLNVNTRGVAATFRADGYHYATISYASIFKILAFLQMGPSDCFVDVGCGKGRVVCCAATLGLKEVMGVEFDASLANVALENLSRMRGRRGVARIMQCAAEDLEYSSATIIYLFNPFGEETLIKFLKALTKKTEIASHKRIKLVYVNPKHRQVFSDFGFQVSVHWRQYEGIVEHEVLFYEVARN